MRFRKKPVEIQAMRIEIDCLDPGKDGHLDPNTESIARVSGWMMGSGFREFKVHGVAPFGIAIYTPDRVFVASPGDWIVRDEQGRFRPCPPDVFEETYERVEESE